MCGAEEAVFRDRKINEEDVTMAGQVGILAAIVIYLVAMVYVGFYFSKKGSGDSTDEFYLGGRKLGPLVTAMSAEASDMSSWLLMGLPGVAYLTGISDAGWTAIGLGLGTYLNWLIVAKRLRRYSVKCNAITIPDFFSRRFRDEKKHSDVYRGDCDSDFLYSLYGVWL